MNGTTHITIGGLTGGLALAVGITSRSMSIDFYHYEIYPLVVTFAGAIGGLAPDIDMAHSKAGRFLRKILRASLIASALFLFIMFFMPQTGITFLDGAIGMGARIDRGIPLVLAAFSIFILLIIEKTKHRGFTHTIVGLATIAAPLAFMVATGVQFIGANIAVSVQVGFVLGWFSHMIIDTFNSKGVSWLWPLTKKRLKIMRITTGSKKEDMFLMYCFVFFIMCYGLILV